VGGAPPSHKIMPRVDLAVTAGGQGSVLVHLEPLYTGGIDEVTPGSNCMANLYSNHHDEIAAEGTSTARRIGPAAR